MVWKNLRAAGSTTKGAMDGVSRLTEMEVFVRGNG